jgi:hypothetical protein
MLATQQDTETHIFGSGCLSYSWYINASRSFEYPEMFPYDAPDGWSWSLSAENPEEGPATVSKVINHDRVIDAMRAIADHGLGKTNQDCVVQCGRFLTDPEDADFDADTADQVLQVVLFGEVVYA